MSRVLALLRAALELTGTIAVFALGPCTIAGDIGVSWDPVPGAIGYRIQVNDNNIVDLGPATAVVAAVPDCQESCVIAQAYNAAGSSAWSDPFCGYPQPTVQSIDPPSIPPDFSGVVTLFGSNLTDSSRPDFRLPADDSQAPGLTWSAYAVQDCSRATFSLTVQPDAPAVGTWLELYLVNSAQTHRWAREYDVLLGTTLTTITIAERTDQIPWP